MQAMTDTHSLARKYDEGMKEALRAKENADRELMSLQKEYVSCTVGGS